MIRILVIILLFSWNLYPQEPPIQVVNSDGEPLPFVIIRSLDSEKWTISDEFGYLRLAESFDSEEILAVERLGYNSIQLTFSELRQRKTIIMTPDPLVLSGIITKGKGHSRSENSFNDKMPSIEQMSSQTYNHYFSQIPGLSIRSYGGPGSVNTLSVNGGTSGNTKILVDGFDLTNTQNGEMDLSQLPLPFIQSARLQQNETGLHGSGSSDGVVHLDPWWDRTGVSLSGGSYGHASISGMYYFKRSGKTARILAGSRKDEGNFPVKWRDRSFLRQNNDFRQDFAGIQYNHLYSQHLFFKMLTLISDQERGVPGTVWSPSSARRNDKLIFSGATIGILRPRNTIRIKVLAKSSDETFTDDWFGIKSNHRIDSYSAKLLQEINYKNSGKLKIGTGVQKDLLTSSDAGERSRLTAFNSISLNRKIYQSFTGSGYSRIEVENGSAPAITWGSSAKFSPYMSPVNGIEVKVETGYRRPSFNELFWKPGGNPDLLPERNISFSATLQARLSNWSTISFNGFHIQSKNLIQWLPYISFWRPVNVSRSDRSGIKGIFRWTILDGKTSGLLSSSYINTVNLGEGPDKDKMLRYTPKFTMFLQLNWNQGNWILSGDVKHTGKILSNYDWPDDIYLPPVTLGNASVNYSRDTRAGKLITTLSIENLSNVHYQSMMGYPETGRSIRITQKWEQK